MIFEGFSQMLLRWLRVPPGVSVRNDNNTLKNGGFGSIEDNDYVSTILDITVDDICLTASPLSYRFKDSITSVPTPVREKVEEICASFNNVLKWIARDLCVTGYSLYDTEVDKDGKFILVPCLDNVEIYADSKLNLMLYSLDEEKKMNLENKILFINYQKNSLMLVEEGMDDRNLTNVKFKVQPIPMQMKHVEKTLKYLTLCENAMMRYRTQLSRIARYVTVDIGASQGDKQTEVVDSIASAINADSLSLDYTDATCEFEDGIPVIPNRKGLGKPEIVEGGLPNYSMGDLGDLKYLLSKLTLICKFPQTYMDFTTKVDADVATTLKGDIRYARMCNSVRTLIEKTINELFNSSKKFSQWGVEFIMSAAPDTEDVDTVSILGEFVDATSKLDQYIVGEGETDPVIMRDRLALIKQIFQGSCSNNNVTAWFDRVENMIESIETAQKKQLEEEQSMEEPPAEQGGQEDFSLK